MKKMTTTFMSVMLLILILTSCNNSGSNQSSKQELDLKKKQLDLKEKELALKEKELNQQISINDSTKKTTETTSKSISNVVNVLAEDGKDLVGRWYGDEVGAEFDVKYKNNKYVLKNDPDNLANHEAAIIGKKVGAKILFDKGIFWNGTTIITIISKQKIKIEGVGCEKALFYSRNN